MAMVDYGAIAWKDGKLISTDTFTDMKDMVGWSDTFFQGNYFAYIGDKDLTIMFYKDMMRIYCPDSEIADEMICFGSGPFEDWRRWRRLYMINSIDDTAEIIVRPRRFHDYYICTMKYRGHKYKVAFGYGVDLSYYKKTHIIDYYGTPWFKVGSWLSDIHYKFEVWRWERGL